MVKKTLKSNQIFLILPIVRDPSTFELEHVRDISAHAFKFSAHASCSVSNLSLSEQRRFHGFPPSMHKVQIKLKREKLPSLYLSTLCPFCLIMYGWKPLRGYLPQLESNPSMNQKMIGMETSSSMNKKMIGIDYEKRRKKESTTQI